MKKISKTLLTTIALVGVSSMFANATPISHITSSSFSLVVNSSNGYDYDRYTDRPAYFYNGRHYYGGEYRNGYYYVDGNRFDGGRYYSHNRMYQQPNLRNSILSLIALPLLMNGQYAYSNVNMHNRVDRHRNYYDARNFYNHRDRFYASRFDTQREYIDRHENERNDRRGEDRYNGDRQPQCDQHREDYRR